MYDCYYCKYLIVNIQIEKLVFGVYRAVTCLYRVTARFRYFDKSFCQMALSNNNLKRELGRRSLLNRLQTV